MPARLKITLTLDEDKTLKELELANQVPRRTKQRASILRLNSRGKTVKEIALYVECASSTVRQTIHRWQKHGLVGLWEAKGRGKKATWTEEDWSAVEKWLSEERSYSARQLSQRLAVEKQVKVGTYKAKNYVQFMNTQANRAMKRLFDTGKYTVIVQDNASIHRANIAKERVEIWEKQGLILFSLPPYSPEMNRIEDQWLYAKRYPCLTPKTSRVSSSCI